MQWLNLEMSVLENEAFGCAETVHVGTWLRLMRYCCVQENSGRIRGAKSWDERKWMYLFRLMKAEIDEKTELWEWDGDDLRVRFFPAAQLKKVNRLREQSAKANKVRWEKHRPNGDPEGIPHGIPDGIRKGIPENETGNPKCKGNSKGKGKDKDKGKDKEKGKGPTPVGDGRKPHDLATVVSFFSERGVPEPEAKKFFYHYQGNGWKQGSGLPIESWQSQSEKWISGWTAEPKKSAAEGGPLADFNPDQPHAHTGGIAVEN